MYSSLSKIKSLMHLSTLNRQKHSIHSANHLLPRLLLETKEVVVIFLCYYPETHVHLKHFRNLFCIRHDFPAYSGQQLANNSKPKQISKAAMVNLLTQHIFCVTHQLKSVTCSISNDLMVPQRQMFPVTSHVCVPVYTQLCDMANVIFICKWLAEFL